jgi:hypothetical protein
MTDPYRFFDYLLESDIHFPELESGQGDGRTIHIARGDMDDDDFDLLHEWIEGDAVDISCSRSDDVYRLEFPDLLVAYVNPVNASVRYEPLMGIDDAALRHLLLDQVLPRLVSGLGEIVVHASCVSRDGYTVAFVGSTGAGKSTLAAGFHDAGWSVLTDDCLLLRGDEAINVSGSYAGIRLLPDSVEALVSLHEKSGPVASWSSKTRISVPGGNNQSVPLNLLVLLGDEDAINLVEVTGGQAVLALIAQSFMLDPTDVGLARERVERYSHIVEQQLPVYELTYPRDYSKISNAIHTIVELSENRI